VLGYWNAIANLTQCIILSGNIKAYNVWMDKLATKYYYKLPVDSTHIDDMLNKYQSIFKSGVLYNSIWSKQLLPTEIQAFAKHFIRNYEKERKITPPYHLVSVIFKTAACCIAIGDANTAIDICNKLLNDYSENINPGSYKYCRIVYIMAHTQIGNTILVTSLVQAYLNAKLSNTGSSEEYFVRQLEGLAKCTSNKQRYKWIDDITTYLQKNKEAKHLTKAIPGLQWLNRMTEASKIR
jgi:hypothetical protein